MANGNHHLEGMSLGVGGLTVSGISWFLEYIGTINSVVHFFILVVTLITVCLGLLRVLKR